MSDGADGRQADGTQAVVGDGEQPPAARVTARVAPRWTWPASLARIPQVTDLVLDVPEPLSGARLTVLVHDGDLHLGEREVTDLQLAPGTNALSPVHVPLAARVMARVTDRLAAECTVTLLDDEGNRVAALRAPVEVQPNNLWVWSSDSASDLVDGGALSRALLASYVRPNHPEVAALAREAAQHLREATGESSFSGFQNTDVAAAERHADDTADAILMALRGRDLSYSEPPPGWDFAREGQRIRDHADVARAGLGTCMDTAVLMAAVMEHVGMMPVLLLTEGHITTGYWRRDPLPDRTPAQWYPAQAVITDAARVRALITGGWLGVTETTAATSGHHDSPAHVRSRATRRAQHLEDGEFLAAIDVVAARLDGVGPLPAVVTADGVAEIHEYRAGGGSVVTPIDPAAVDAVDDALAERQGDSHPPRYRTWKSSLFSLNATNALLNLGSNPRVQPLLLPPESLGVLEDRLHEDVTFTLRSGYDLPEVWQARGTRNAIEMLERGEEADLADLREQLEHRTLFVQRVGTKAGQPTALAPSTFLRELRSMAHRAKTSREEKGMNPLFLCLGTLHWPHKPGVMATAPLILVPVNLSPVRRGTTLTLTLDATQQTTPNAALIEWLRREHDLVIPGLAEPATDRAGIDVDAVLSEVREAVARRGLPFVVRAEASLATLDLSAFRKWQDLTAHAETFLARPLVHHLVHTPTDPFLDPALTTADAHAADQPHKAQPHEDLPDEEVLDALETPVPADATQKQAVLWAQQGRSFVLQGPPGTGKSQTITNMIAACVMAGMSVLFVAEKGTALEVVQRRLDEIGLGPFTLNLHHEGSNATVVRAQLKRSLAARVTPDPAAMDTARRRLRTARFELGAYPHHLHARNAAGHSAYSARDELLVLGEGESIPIDAEVVRREEGVVATLRGLVADIQPWTAAARVAPHHPWLLAGPGAGDPFDLHATSEAIRGVLDGAAWAGQAGGALSEALASATEVAHLDTLVAGADPRLPAGADLSAVLAPEWPTATEQTVRTCQDALADAVARLHGLDPSILQVDLTLVAEAVSRANAAGFLGRRRKQREALAPLQQCAPAGTEIDPDDAARLVQDLQRSQQLLGWVAETLTATPGLREVSDAVVRQLLHPDALAPVRARLAEVTAATAALRGEDAWTQRARELAIAGDLRRCGRELTAWRDAWATLARELTIDDRDLAAWRDGGGLLSRVLQVSEAWRHDLERERLLGLQQWCALMRRLEPLREAGLEDARSGILSGAVRADTAEESLLRGLAEASLTERMTTEGLDRFNPVAHNDRVQTYTAAQGRTRREWITTGPATLLERRALVRESAHVGRLARELEKTTRRLGTRAILRTHSEAVAALTPVVLGSPSSVVDLIEPGTMDFDVVVFDEASQITVPEAVGSLGRARAAIIVGDSKQMPPTARVGGPTGPAQNEDVASDSQDDLEEEIVEDQESILSECELASVPPLRLSWHYRSQDEALIDFSNRTYYTGALSSFPTPSLLSTETGLEYRLVPDGQYLRSGARAGHDPVQLPGGVVAGTNTNPVEAQAVVGYVHELVHAGPDLPSLGIVTFNEPQRQLIEDLLVASTDPRVAAVMDETRMGRREVLFVKALEQVQGDERDTVIFSVAFSKQANGRIPTNFGPLSRAGGERRLNVAVTRARRKNVVFASFDPAELDVSGSSYRGPKDLKDYLAFVKASSAGTAVAPPESRAPIRDRHRDEVAAVLRSLGFHVMTDVGMSTFRLDLVLARAEDPDRPVLPVLLDGESWMTRHTVSDRDVLPVEVLTNLMGWPAVARVWWPMWLQNPDDVLERLTRAFDEAVAVLDARDAAALAEAESAAAAGEVEAVTEAADDTDGSTPSADAVAGDAHDDADDAETDPVPALIRAAPAPEALAVPASDRDEPAPPDPVAGFDSQPSLAPEMEAQGVLEVPTESDRPSRRDLREAPAISDFVPAPIEVVAGVDVLDALPGKAAAARVREQIVEIIESEGPVELSRLLRLTGRRFGLSAVRSSRAEQMSRHVPRDLIRRERLGTFVWPRTLDPDTWAGFRTDHAGTRTLEEVAPQEIANAMRAYLAEYPEAGEEDVMRRVGLVFGVTRMGAKVRARLEAVYASL